MRRDAIIAGKKMPSLYLPLESGGGVMVLEIRPF